MKKSTVPKSYQSSQTPQNNADRNQPGSFQTSMGLAMDKYERSEKVLENAHALPVLKDRSR